jgi:transcriptional regulator of acetoin/glycerol metabolism
MRELRDNQFGRRYYAEKPAQRAKDRRQQRVGVDLGPDGLRQGGLRQSPALRQQAGGACVHRPLEHAEREVLLGVIAQHRWNMSQVAAQLGISRNTLYRKIKRHGIVIARRPGGC